MCGLLAAFGLTNPEQFLQTAGLMQRHRGPDFQSDFTVKQGDVYAGLAHQRLSVMDLSAAAHQPMKSRSGRLAMVFNGEIYNYNELAARYGMIDLRSNGDSEVALELIEKIGIEAASAEFNGMWAIIVLDMANNQVLFSRDRFGKKPLYHTYVRGAHYFASETKSFLSIEGFDHKPDSVTAALFLSQSLSNIDNRTWFENAHCFPAGHTGKLRLDNLFSGLMDVNPYWCLHDDHASQTQIRFDDLRDLVSDAIRLRLNANVPTGIALSGGLDSSIIAAVARQLQRDDLFLLSVTSPGHNEDEGHFIDVMAGHLDNRVEKFSLEDSGEDNLTEIFQNCLWHNDGPLPSFSPVLFYKLMEIANSFGVTVILTGQGADEAFCGYRKYPFFAARALLRQRRFVEAMRFLGGFVANGTMLPQLKLKEMKRYLGQSNVSVLGEATARANILERMIPDGSDVSSRQREDILRYSVPYLCHYEDRMSMAWSREIRSPFLDYRVVSAGLKMPYDQKMKNGWTKYALRRAFENDLPSQIVWRKDKKGFTNPQDTWLTKTLRTHVLDTMSDPKAPVYVDGLVNRENYLALFKRFCEGSSTIWFRDVFAPYSLNSWLTRVKDHF